ncbi:hypothetical protein Q1695_012074 [Nippostrongylus brasiliensis]|nr:hypothetical protein Q1695_012074 [Nippostrongylus brasiliensis]
MPATAPTPTKSASKKRKYGSPLLPPTSSAGCEEVFNKLQCILEQKAPEALPLLEELMVLLTPNPKEIVDAEKRSRSVVISGIPKADPSTSPSARQAATERYVINILDELGVETKPSEVFRSGPLNDTKTPRLVKCVFSSHRFFFDVLKNAKRLRALPEFRDIFIRRSMTPAERQKDRELRLQARQLNKSEFNGERVYVVYKEQVIKRSDIPKLGQRGAKNH